MIGFGQFFKRNFWWLIPLWGLFGYFGWKVDEVMAIIQKLGEGL